MQVSEQYCRAGSSAHQAAGPTWARLRRVPKRPKNIGRVRSDGDDPEGADSKDRRTRYPRTGDLHYRSFRYRRIKEIGSSLSPSSHLLRSSLQQSPPGNMALLVECGV